MTPTHTLQAHELYLKALLNPFYSASSQARIESKAFDAGVRALARRYLNFGG